MNASSLEAALRLVEEGERDPVRAVRNQEKIGSLLRRAKSEHTPRAPQKSAHGDVLAHVLSRIERLLEANARPLAALAATHIVRVDDVPPLSPGDTTGALKIRSSSNVGAA